MIRELRELFGDMTAAEIWKEAGSGILAFVLIWAASILILSTV